MELVEKTNFCIFEIEYKYKNFVEKLSNKNNLLSFLASRIVAVSISALESFALAYDLFYITFHSICALGYSIVYFKSPLKYCSTTRNIAVTAAETARHFFGACLGTLTGLISPSFAAKKFMPSNQAFMETRDENMTPEQASRIYSMLEIVHNIFENKKISYCMTGGTQLGACRHDGIIPWDDDADLFILENDKIKVESLKEDLEKEGIGMIPCHLGFKFFDLNGSGIKEGSLVYRYPFIDICFAKDDGKGRITYANEHFKRNYAGEYLLVSEWENRTLQKFGPLQLYGAPNPEKYCKRMYGDSVFNYGYQLLNHRTFKLEIPKKYYLEKEANGKCKSAAVNCPI